MQKENLVIIGSGPAGLMAATYAARANLNPLVIVGNQAGGQIAITNEVENFPGFDSILGPELTDKMKAQAEKFGARFEFDEVTEVKFAAGQPLYVKTYGEEYEARAVIVATGASARRLGIPGEADFIGKGVSYCATCDGFFFKGKDVLVVGGGDSALQEGIFLTKFANRVRIVHRRNALRAANCSKSAPPRTKRLNSCWTRRWMSSKARARSRRCRRAMSKPARRRAGRPMACLSLWATSLIPNSLRGNSPWTSRTSCW